MKKIYFLVSLMAGFISGIGDVKAQSCNCTQYIYMNDTNFDITHKFRINANGSLTEITNGSNIQQAWAQWSTDNSNDGPHGLAQDLNGNVYIGSRTSGPIYKIPCDGVTGNVESSGFATNVIASGGSNFISLNGNLIKNNLSGGSNLTLQTYSLCSPYSLIGQTSLTGSSDDWGLSLGDDGNTYLGTPYNGFSTAQIYRFPSTLSNFTSGSQSPWISNYSALFKAYLPIYSGVPDSDIQIWGIDADENGNVYTITFVITGGSTNVWFLTKINSSGTIVDSHQAPYDEEFNQGAGGLVYDKVTKNLYVVGGANVDFSNSVNPNCLNVYSSATLDLQPGLSIPYVLGQVPKGIAMTTECCPDPVNAVYNRNLCDVSANSKLFLQELLGTSCPGPICGGTWAPSGSLTGMTFDPCDNSIVVTDPATACGSFALTGGSVQCGAFTVTLNLKFGDVGQPVVSMPSCSGSNPSQLSITQTAGSSLSYQWQESTTSATSGFTDISGATSSTYTPVASASTKWYRVITTASLSCGAGCSKTSDAVQQDPCAVLGSIAGEVWPDQGTPNGILDLPETFADPQTVKVELVQPDGFGGFTVLQTVNTTGTYLFPNLPDGTYYVRFTPTAGDELTLQDQGGNDANDSDPIQGNINPIAVGLSGPYTISGGNNITEVDAGIVPAANASVFPVRINSFEGSQIENRISLSWETSEMLNFKSFEIERSKDAKSYERIGKIDADIQTAFYQFWDEQPNLGDNYYRLKLLDFDNKHNYSKTLNVSFEKGAEFMYFENPPSGETVWVKTNIENTNFRVFDNNGRPIGYKIIYHMNEGYELQFDRHEKVIFISLNGKTGIITKRAVFK